MTLDNLISKLDEIALSSHENPNSTVKIRFETVRCGIPVIAEKDFRILVQRGFIILEEIQNDKT